MKKRALIFLVLAMVVAGGAFADWYDSYAPGIDESKVFVNAGIGFTVGRNGGIPPISVSADFKLPISMPITLGVMGRLSTSDTYKFGNLEYTYVDIGIGARGLYHFNFVQNLDTYAGVTLGYNIQTVSYKGDWPDAIKDNYKGVSYFLWGVKLGGRYFFTKNIGAFIELDYMGWITPGIGLSLKF
jgi:hypothetical protein